LKGFRVGLDSLDTVDVSDATGYEVTPTGDLVLRRDEHVVSNFVAGAWTVVSPIGDPIADHWPPPGLASLLAELGELLGVRWGQYVHDLPCTDELESAWFNDEDRLVDAVLARTDACGDGRLRSEVLAVLRRHARRWSAGPAAT